MLMLVNTYYLNFKEKIKSLLNRIKDFNQEKKLYLQI